MPAVCPLLRAFRLSTLQKRRQQLLESEGPHILQYSYTEGEPRLRKAIAKRETEKGNITDWEEVLIVSGSQQALDLLGLAYIEEGHKIGVESPTYLGALQAFRMYHPTSSRSRPMNSD